MKLYTLLQCVVSRSCMTDTWRIRNTMLKIFANLYTFIHTYVSILIEDLSLLEEYTNMEFKISPGVGFKLLLKKRRRTQVDTTHRFFSPQVNKLKIQVRQIK